jgi:hypothetical protein
VTYKKIISAILIVFLSVFNGGALANAVTHHKPLHVPASERWFLPILQEGPAAVEGFTCVIMKESTSTPTHPNLGDNNGSPGQSGIFQMNNQPGGVWDVYVMPFLHVVLWKATPFQQAWGAARIWRIERFYPWTRYDGCS